MQNATPYEILGAPFEVWAAPVATAFPLVDAAPAVAWVKVGSSGDLNYTQDGVTVEQSQNINMFRAAGDTGSRKVFRTQEDFKIRLTLADMTLEQYKHALNSNSITTVAAAAGVPGTKSIGLSRGLSVATMALLVRGPSPYMADGVAQFEVPIAAQTGNPQPVFKNGEAAGLALEWTALVDTSASDPSEYFGRLIAQTDVAL